MEKDIETMLNKVLNALADEQNNAIEEMKKKLQLQLATDPQRWNQCWQITTALVPEAERMTWQDRGYTSVNEEISSIFHPDWNTLQGPDTLEERGHREYFWRGTYASWQAEVSANKTYHGRFTDRDGETRDFTYYLVSSAELIEKEERLYHLAMVYHIQRPVIFSPFSRRLVSIRLTDDILPMTAAEFFAGQYDFCWQENGLQERILEGRELFWNIRAYDDEDGESRIVPDPSTSCTRHIQCFWDVNENTFIGLYKAAEKDSCWEEIAEKTDKKIVLYGEASGPAPAIDIQALDPEPEFTPCLFKNAYELPLWGSSGRLYSRADVVRQVQRYAVPWVQVTDISLQVKEKKPVAGYLQRDQYGYFLPKEVRIYQREKLRCLPPCYLSFRLLDHRYQNFLEDYAAYVLADLGLRFPDFQWQGVIEDE